jgi:hypothetical protein
MISRLIKMISKINIFNSKNIIIQGLFLNTLLLKNVTNGCLIYLLVVELIFTNQIILTVLVKILNILVKILIL